MYQSKRLCAALALLAMAGCASTRPDVARELVSDGRLMAQAPEGAPFGTCWAKDFSPAVVETITEQVELSPAVLAADGSVVSPAAYRTETRQAIVKPRQEILFETPCPETMSLEFVASLQRALSARDLYGGVISGLMDNRTRAAIRGYQKPKGLDSGILSMDAARALGLVAQARPLNES